MIKKTSKKGLFLLFLVALFIFPSRVFAAKVDTVDTYSAAMKKSIKAVIITPDSYVKTKTYPVLYLLHGYGGNYADYVNVFPIVKTYADDYGLIIVCVDGQKSWYLDSPVDPKLKYETYVSAELVSWVDSHYSSIKNKTGRAIMGLSMGGHGALYLAFKHPELYGAAGSMSGGVDIRPFPENWDLSKTLGSKSAMPQNWEDHTVINMVDSSRNNYPALSIDCGTKDFFYKVNVDFHDKLLANHIPHDFIVRNGEHNIDYWSNAIKYQFLFMHLYFEKQSVKK